MTPRYIGLAGLGLLGRGIATCLLDHGFHVIALETNPVDALNSSAFVLASDVSELAGCELVIESITENLEAKVALFQELEKHVGRDVPISSNTSSIPITLMQKGRQHPERFAGMHWSSPAYATPFLEIIRGDHTSDITIKKVFDVAIELGKDPAVVQRDLPGFVANRLAYAMYREAIYMLEEGVADMQAIDRLCQHSIGHWTSFCGPFRWMDITGGPALYATAMQRIIPTLCNEPEVSKTMQTMKAAELGGTKSGQGFYSYEPGDHAEWQAKLLAHALKK